MIKTELQEYKNKGFDVISSYGLHSTNNYLVLNFSHFHNKWVTASLWKIKKDTVECQWTLPFDEGLDLIEDIFIPDNQEVCKCHVIRPSSKQMSEYLECIALI